MLPHQADMFGGSWTEQKLDRVTRYLQAYTTALKNQRFRLVYIDAFAGTGYRAKRKAGVKARGLFTVQEKDELAEGSARRALAVDPPFDEYIFIEKDSGRFEALERLVDDFPQHHDRICCLNRDANEAVVEICDKTDWVANRAVLFLDPYGMQVEWSTLEAIAETGAIDVWLLFPIGVVHRLAPKTGLKPAWSTLLDRAFGDEKWRDVIYKTEQYSDLLGTHDRPKRGTNEDIENYLRSRLETIFRGKVSEHAMPLRNKRGSCMFLLMFASGNPRPNAHSLAHKIAGYILEN